MNPELAGGERSKARVRKAVKMGSGDATIFVPFPRSGGCFSRRPRALNVVPAGPRS